MKQITCTILLFCIFSGAHAQSETNNSNKIFTGRANTFKIIFSDFFIKDRATLSPFRINNFSSQMGFAYERKVYRNWYAGLQYCEWANYNGFNKYDLGIQEIRNYPPIVGEMYKRENYNMVDLYGLYKYNPGNSHHSFNVGVGLSYCWGNNVYISEFIKAPPSIFEDYIGYEDRKEAYWGIVPQISYDYSFLKNRLCIGADFKGRYYAGRPRAQYDVGFHIGVKF